MLCALCVFNSRVSDVKKQCLGSVRGPDPASPPLPCHHRNNNPSWQDPSSGWQTKCPSVRLTYLPRDQQAQGDAQKPSPGSAAAGRVDDGERRDGPDVESMKSSEGNRR
ncbi:hypothetical protein DPEC_G00043560 [Dallia pectoralis]|uniref:Uncharacterized protein n=1 Tax=Dallia pectoralis TaxID=75939 RepID=A0ACC2H928_DALPE|nr:hypothetical protein DPEC_G00043560 [Dallia pectoralis]